MDGENNGKPYENGWFGGKTHHLRKHLYVFFNDPYFHPSPDTLKAFTREVEGKCGLSAVIFLPSITHRYP